ncbi:hypothetical protein CBS101457_003018 [Exobasidium rhododendri]|nr:hypothetical protein CBS101457_003018 [Exobasidium rhododendri]
MLPLDKFVILAMVSSLAGLVAATPTPMDGEWNHSLGRYGESSSRRSQTPRAGNYPTDAATWAGAETSRVRGSHANRRHDTSDYPTPSYGMSNDAAYAHQQDPFYGYDPSQQFSNFSLDHTYQQPYQQAQVDHYPDYTNQVQTDWNTGLQGGYHALPPNVQSYAQDVQPTFYVDQQQAHPYPEEVPDQYESSQEYLDKYGIRLGFEWHNELQHCWDSMKSDHKKKLVKTLRNQRGENESVVKKRLKTRLTPVLAIASLQEQDHEFQRAAVEILNAPTELPAEEASNKLKWWFCLSHDEQQALLARISQITGRSVVDIYHWLNQSDVLPENAHYLLHHKKPEGVMKFVTKHGLMGFNIDDDQ